MAEGFIQVNVNLTSEDDQALDRMMNASGYDNRSAFVRWLIRQEWARREKLIQTPSERHIQSQPLTEPQEAEEAVSK